MDFTLYKDLNRFALHHDRWEDVARFFANDSPYLFAALIVVLFLARGRLASVTGRRGAVAAVFSGALALAVAKVVSEIVARQRPFVDHPQAAHLFISHARDYGFPSDHVTGGFAIAVALALRHRAAGAVALALAAVVAVARVMVGVHYPSDVVGGAVIGTLVALVLWHPRVRGPLDALADWLAALYERLAGAVLRRPAPA